jgi:hypothetical protein
MQRGGSRYSLAPRNRLSFDRLRLNAPEFARLTTC